jgi:hypothetical protein
MWTTIRYYAGRLTYAAWMLRSRLRPDERYLDPQVPLSRIANHANNAAYLAGFANRKGMRVLEVGSREVTSRSTARTRFAEAEYVGFDFYPGPNVDVVGDAHALAGYFPGQKFDLIYTSACFEHFAMPWIVATEMAKLLKVGGMVFVETHFSYASHERPWHFFQFSDMALRVLFSEAIGIECVEAGMSNPMVGRFTSLADRYLRFERVPRLYCHSEFLGRKVRDVPDFSWADVDPREVVGNTVYPEPGR